MGRQRDLRQLLSQKRRKARPIQRRRFRGLQALWPLNSKTALSIRLRTFLHHLPIQQPESHSIVERDGLACYHYIRFDDTRRERRRGSCRIVRGRFARQCSKASEGVERICESKLASRRNKTSFAQPGSPRVLLL